MCRSAAERRAGVVLDQGSPAVCCGDPVVVARLGPQPSSLGDRDHRVGQPAHHVLLEAQPLEQRGPLGLVAAGVGERQLEEGGGLAVRPRLRRLGGRPVGIGTGARVVAGRVGVVGEHGRIGGADALERLEDPGVQVGGHPRRDGVLDGAGGPARAG